MLLIYTFSHAIGMLSLKNEALCMTCILAVESFCQSLNPQLQEMFFFSGYLFRRVIHTVGPKYAVKYHTAAENALSHCYRSCLELLIDNGLQRYAK